MPWYPCQLIKRTTTNVAGVTTTNNIYKPPTTLLSADLLPCYLQPCIYARDLIAAAQHGAIATKTGTETRSRNGWQLLTSTSSTIPNNRVASDPHTGYVNKPWPRIHQPRLSSSDQENPPPIPEVPASSITNWDIWILTPIPTLPVKWWNFWKATWEKFTNILNLKASTLPIPTSDLDAAYSTWCSTIINSQL